MSNFNKLFLALAFLGGSAAAQAGDDRLDPARFEWGRTGERSAGADSWARDMGGTRASRMAATAYAPVVYAQRSATYNGRPVDHEHLLGRYDVKRAVPVQYLS